MFLRLPTASFVPLDNELSRYQWAALKELKNLLENKDDINSHDELNPSNRSDGGYLYHYPEIHMFPRIDIAIPEGY